MNKLIDRLQNELDIANKCDCQAVIFEFRKEELEALIESLKLASVAQELEEIVEMIDTEQFITGDSIKRTNPHSKIILNSGSSWLVTKDLRSALNAKLFKEKVNVTP